jgi:PAB1-binding protein PBP1
LIVTLFPKLQLPGLVRVSLGIENSIEDIDTLLKVLSQIREKSKVSTESSSASLKSERVLTPRADVQMQIDEFKREVARRVYS